MKDLVFAGNVGDLDSALRWVESELTATDPNVQSALAVQIWSTALLAGALDRLAAPVGN